MQILTKLELKNDLKNAFEEFITFFEAQSEETINQEIVVGKWTMAQHLYHLIKSTKAVTKGLQMPKMALRTMFGKNNRAERSPDKMYEKYKSVLAESNLKAPPEFAAESGRTFEQSKIVQRFRDELRDMLKIVEKWDEDDLSTYLLPHPAIGKCTLREMVMFTSLHTRHHLSILKEQYQ